MILEKPEMIEDQIELQVCPSETPSPSEIYNSVASVAILMARRSKPPKVFLTPKSNGIRNFTLAHCNSISSRLTDSLRLLLLLISHELN